MYDLDPAAFSHRRQVFGPDRGLWLYERALSGLSDRVS